MRTEESNSRKTGAAVAYVEALCQRSRVHVALNFCGSPLACVAVMNLHVSHCCDEQQEGAVCTAKPAKQITILVVWDHYGDTRQEVALNHNI